MERFVVNFSVEVGVVTLSAATLGVTQRAFRVSHSLSCLLCWTVGRWNVGERPARLELQGLPTAEQGFPASWIFTSIHGITSGVWVELGKR